VYENQENWRIEHPIVNKRKMKSMTIEFTHKGWFLGIPVYYAELESDAPYIVERHWSLSVPFVVASLIGGLWTWFRSSIDDSYDPHFELFVTGQLSSPVVMEDGHD
jgi:hypothetical protein